MTVAAPIVCPMCSCLTDLGELEQLAGVSEASISVVFACHCGARWIEGVDRAEWGEIVFELAQVQFATELDVLDDVEKMQRLWSDQEQTAPDSVVHEPKGEDLG